MSSFSRDTVFIVTVLLIGSVYPWKVKCCIIQCADYLSLSFTSTMFYLSMYCNLKLTLHLLYRKHFIPQGSNQVIVKGLKKQIHFCWENRTWFQLHCGAYFSPLSVLFLYDNYLVKHCHVITQEGEPVSVSQFHQGSHKPANKHGIFSHFQKNSGF